MTEMRQLQERDRTFLALLGAAAVLLLVLPFFVTFNEAITKGVQAIGGDRWLASWIEPYEGRLAAAFLLLVGIPASVGPGSLILGSSDFPTVLNITWNCVGWQSVLLFSLSCVTALAGDHPRSAKIAAGLVGLLGLLLMNIVRIAVVGMVAFWFGNLPAIIVHDYGTILASIAYLIGFWALAYQTMLREEDPA